MAGVVISELRVQGNAGAWHHVASFNPCRNSTAICKGKPGPLSALDRLAPPDTPPSSWLKSRRPRRQAAQPRQRNQRPHHDLHRPQYHPHLRHRYRSRRHPAHFPLDPRPKRSPFMCGANTCKTHRLARSCLTSSWHSSSWLALYNSCTVYWPETTYDHSLARATGRSPLFLTSLQPFNAFLSGFSAAVGQFVLTASLRMQTSETPPVGASNSGKKSTTKSIDGLTGDVTEQGINTKISSERAFADFVFGSLILHGFCINFIN